MHVLIVGCGLGGIMLSALLERVPGITYQVFERSEEVRPLGSAMSVGATILPVFQQLGIYEETMRHAQPMMRGVSRSFPERTPQITDYSVLKERYGDYSYVLARPKLYEIIWRLVPKDKILLGKKVMSIQQNTEGVMIRCSDNTTYHGDVLVGADGAYSAVRQALYKQMKQKGLLPREDDSPPPFNTFCLVGITQPMPPGSFEMPEEGICRGESRIYRNLPYATVCFTLPDGAVAWLVLQHAGSFTTRNEERFRNSEWGPEASSTMADQVRDLLSPFGPPMSHFIDRTDKNLISKVMLEEKMYNTWHYGRTVLLGDACHKYFPAAGQGAVNAMLDAVVLANVLAACPSSHIDDVRCCLDAYKQERFKPAMIGFEASSRMGELYKKTILGRLLRFIMSILPRSLIIAQFDKLLRYTPQASFLPQVKVERTSQPYPQRTYDHLRKSTSVAV